MEFGQTFESLAPVISLTIIDQATLDAGLISDSTRILVVVRDPKTNTAHPNVVSVPTQRIPASLHLEICGATPGFGESLKEHSHSISMVSNRLVNGHNPIIYAVESLLSSKLGLAEHLESGQLCFQAKLRLVKAGKSYQLNNFTDEQVHYISMANIIVVISDGVKLFPSKTASYSHISWVEVSRFFNTVEQRNPEILGVGLNSIDFCVHGLCIATTYELLTAVVGKDLYQTLK
ncbi:MAG TPA: hypothetical protein VK206_25615 [Anaerolineales bacterium]|nr:hypothetical protein [Anaerolineales bacterium]HLO32079.1 hypothetical protein [Anaerolineales bacterium]